MRRDILIDPDTTLLGSSFPLSLERPFTRLQAERVGLGPAVVERLARDGQLRRVLPGVYAAAQAPDNVRFRAGALALVIPEQVVVTDRTAAWLHGIPALQRGAHLTAPPLDVSDTRDTRVRRPGVNGTRRRLARRDVVLVDGIRATTLLRTATDLGRLLWKFDAIAALDAIVAAGVDIETLVQESARFPGFRGVRQLRGLLPLVDPRSESPGESALRLRWHEAGLPKPVLQYVVQDGAWARFRLDLAAPAVRYAAEYDGEAFHTAEEDLARDEFRRGWLAARGWTVDVFTRADVYGPAAQVEERLRAGIAEARRRLARWQE